MILLDPTDPLSRFLKSKRQYSKEKNRVKEGAFLPPQDRKLSVFQTKEMSEAAIWELGEEAFSASKKPVTLRGRADLSVSAVLKTNLKVEPDNDPPRHANIIGWPEEKSDQKSIAQELASEATLHLLQ